MAELPTYFADFLASIRLTEEQVKELKEAHTTLRDRLAQDEKLSAIEVSNFLQGSYRRATTIRPAEGARVDVDVIEVTKLDRSTYTPHQAMEVFQEFLDQHYAGKWKLQGRSIGIALETVDLDLVITSAPSEATQKALRSASVRSMESLEEAPDLRFNEFWVPLEQRTRLESTSWMRKSAQEAEWRTEPLWIPDRDAKIWQQTHPLEQLRQTRDKNARTEGHFVNVVKAVKWWWRRTAAEAEQPKSYPLERIVWECCPDSIRSVARGLTETLEQIVVRFELAAASETTPVLCDHGTSQDVLKRISGEEFGHFYEQVKPAAAAAREALEEPEKAKSAKLWGDLLGGEFPSPPEGNGDPEGSKGGGTPGGYSERGGQSVLGTGRFA